MKTTKVLTILVLTLALGAKVVKAATINQAPIADAGLSRYAAHDPVVLDGTGSYDPDDSGPLSYTWRQIAGPSVIIIDANTATPTICGSMQPSEGRDPTPKPGGFTQTDVIQECEFELVVSDGELISLPDTVKVIVVPDFGVSTFRLLNTPFDAGKPTIIYFGGGDCTSGLAVDAGSPFTSAWLSRANIIFFPNGYSLDSGEKTRTYYKHGDMIIVYLSAVAPNYNQPIQTSGWSTGGQPAVDVGIRLNLIYADARYAINRVTFFDATTYCRANYSESITTFLDSSVDGEQCWVDAYVSTTSGLGYHNPPFHESVLNVWFPAAVGSWFQRHILAKNWYCTSLTDNDMNEFNQGVVAGAYWSVIGPGKNLQLASTPGIETYKFAWYGNDSSGYMDFYDDANYPGRLPEPVTLVGPTDGAVIDSNGAVLSCQESENAVGYQLLFGPDLYHMSYLFSDTPYPPSDTVTFYPFKQTWWTVRAYDQYGSTIYADPLHIHPDSVITQTIENVITGQRYASVQQAINDAHPGDEIVVSPGTCQYLENINFKGKNLTVRSTDPNDSSVVAATVINGSHRHSVITFSGGEDSSCLLDGFTITGGIVGISCRAASPTIRNCNIESTSDIAIEFWGDGPNIIDCTVHGKVWGQEIWASALLAHWKLDETEGDLAYNSTCDNHGILSGNPTWKPESGQIGGALEFDGTDDHITTDFVLNPASESFSAFAWIKSSAPGKVSISQINGVDWLSVDAEGQLMTELKRGFIAPNLISGSVIIDGDWHHIGVVWNGSNRLLYVDGAEVASDTTIGYLKALNGGLHIGAGKNLEAGSFFSGLIDDVRVYDRAITP